MEMGVSSMTCSNWILMHFRRVTLTDQSSRRPSRASTPPTNALPECERPVRRMAVARLLNRSDRDQSQAEPASEFASPDRSSGIARDAQLKVVLEHVSRAGTARRSAPLTRSHLSTLSSRAGGPGVRPPSPSGGEDGPASERGARWGSTLDVAFRPRTLHRHWLKR